MHLTINGGGDDDNMYQKTRHIWRGGLLGEIKKIFNLLGIRTTVSSPPPPASSERITPRSTTTTTTRDTGKFIRSGWRVLGRGGGGGVEPEAISNLEAPRSTLFPEREKKFGRPFLLLGRPFRHKAGAFALPSRKEAGNLTIKLPPLLTQPLERKKTKRS